MGESPASLLPCPPLPLLTQPPPPSAKDLGVPFTSSKAEQRGGEIRGLWPFYLLSSDLDQTEHLMLIKAAFASVLDGAPCWERCSLIMIMLCGRVTLSEKMTAIKGGHSTRFTD